MTHYWRKRLAHASFTTQHIVVRYISHVPRHINHAYCLLIPTILSYSLESSGLISFTSLPAELQCLTICLLDPISLISASQINTHFRRLISPENKHFAQRLIAFEDSLHYGGSNPVFQARGNELDSDWNHERWDEIRWTCSECLRLLPHKSFDNHSVLRLVYRKPIPGSPATFLITSWEPSGQKKRLPYQKLNRGIEQDAEERNCDMHSTSSLRAVVVGRYTASVMNADS